MPFHKCPRVANIKNINKRHQRALLEEEKVHCMYAIGSPTMKHTEIYTMVTTVKFCDLHNPNTNYHWDSCSNYKWKQDRTLRQRKNPPANKLPYVTSWLIWKILQAYVQCADPPTTENLHDLDVDISRYHKVKYDGGVGLPIYDIRLMF